MEEITKPVVSSVSDPSLQIDFLVKQYLKDIERLRDELKEQKDMLKDATNSDAAYKEIDNQIKDLVKKKKTIASETRQRTGVEETVAEIQKITEELKSAEKKLSEYLRKYVEEYKSTTLEDDNGNVRDIITTYKLVKRTI